MAVLEPVVARTVPYQQPCTIKRIAGTAIVVGAGQYLKLETSPGGEELIYATVPPGKQWEITLTIQITETDV